MTEETHLYELAMRWGDLDSHNHVNNVVYGDYAAEAQFALREAGRIPPESQVSSVEIVFRRQLLLTEKPITIRSTFESDVLTQAITSQTDDGTSEHADVVTTFGPRAELDVSRPEVPILQAKVRHQDLGADGYVRPAAMLALVQEGRSRFARSHGSILKPGTFVIGGLTMRLGAPLPWRHQPYEVHIWIGRIGTKSVTSELLIADGDTIFAHASSTQVAYDPDTKRSRALRDDELSHVQQIQGLSPQS